MIIVLLREQGYITAKYIQNLINNREDISDDDKKRIQIINFSDYLSFLNLGKESKFQSVIDLVINAFHSDEELERLKKLKVKYSILLKSEFNKSMM